MNTPIPEILLDTQCRFWSKVDRRSENECWNWLGATNGGYGSFRVKYNVYLAHRISYYIYFNKDPGELEVCHECNNTLCVNPNHLFLGTHSANMQYAFDCNRKSHAGILNTRTSLMESDIREIRKLKEIMTLKEIAQIYNVSRSTIGAIVTGQNWAHVKESN